MSGSYRVDSEILAPELGGDGVFLPEGPVFPFTIFSKHRRMMGYLKKESVLQLTLYS